MSDAARREIERELRGDDARAFARVLGERLRAGEIAREKVELAAFCGDEAACFVLGSAPAPRKLDELVAGLEAWGREACFEGAAAAVVFAEPKTWRDVDAFAGQAYELEQAATGSDAARRLALLAHGVTRGGRDPGVLRRGIEDRVAAWALGKPRASYVASIPAEREVDGDPWIVALANRLVEHAHACYASRLAMSPDPETPDAAVDFEVGGAWRRETRLPERALAFLELRYAVMASLDLLDRSTPRTGEIDFARWSRAGLSLRVRATVARRSVTLELVAGS